MDGFSRIAPATHQLSSKNKGQIVMQLHAGLYQAGPRNRYFDLKAVVGWLANSAFQSAVVFVMVMGALAPQYADRHSGRTPGQWQAGATLFTAVVITVHLEISSVIDHWTWLHAFSVIFSVCKLPTLLHCALLCCTVLCSAVLYCAVLCRAVLCCAVLHWAYSYLWTWCWPAVVLDHFGAFVEDLSHHVAVVILDADHSDRPPFG